MAELEPPCDGTRRRQRLRLRADHRLHIEECDQISQEESLIRNRGKSRKRLLQVRTRFADGIGQESQCTESEDTGNGAPYRVDISGVITGSTNRGQYSPGHHLAPRQSDILFVNLVRQLLESAGQKPLKSEQLEFLGRLLAAPEYPEVVQLPPDWGLPKVLRVSQKS